MRVVICLLSFLFFSLYSFGQWRLSAKLIASNQQVTDKYFSAVPFSGIHYGVAASAQFTKNNNLHEWETGFSTGSIETHTNPAASGKQSLFAFNYYNLYKVSPGNTSPWTIRAGGSINVLYAKRSYDDFINNNTSGEFAASLSAAAEATVDFGEALPGLSLSDQLTVPFVSALAQPAFGEKLSGGSVFSNMQAGSFSSFLRIKNKLALDKKITDNQSISLSYIWDYYRFTTDRRVYQAGHKLALQYSFTL